MCNRTYWPFRKKYWGICSDLEGFSLMSACPKVLEEDPKLSGNFMAISARTGLKIPFQYSWRYLLLYPGWRCKFDCYFLLVSLWISLQVPWFPSERVPKVFRGTASKMWAISWEVFSLTYGLIFPWWIMSHGGFVVFHTLHRGQMTQYYVPIWLSSLLRIHLCFPRSGGLPS